MLKQVSIRIVKAKLLFGIFAISSGLSLAVLTSNSAKAGDDMGFDDEFADCSSTECPGSGVACCKSKEGSLFYKGKDM